MNIKELQRWILKNDEEDSWWVALNGVVQDNVMSLPDISRFQEDNRDSQVSILHVSEANNQNAQWIIFERTEPRKVRLASAPQSSSQQAPQTAAPFPAFQQQEPPLAAAPVNDAVMEDIAQIRRENQELKAEIKALKGEMTKLKAELHTFKQLVDELKEPIMEAHTLLEERERFLEIGENSLFEKAQKQEVLQTELEQLREELHKRERFLDAREAALETKAAV